MRKCGWDKQHEKSLDVISRRVTFHDAKNENGLNWYFRIMGQYNLYFDELAIMVEFLQAKGLLRFKLNTLEDNRL